MSYKWIKDDESGGQPEECKIRELDSEGRNDDEDG